MHRTDRTTHGAHGHVFHDADGRFRAISTLRHLGASFSTLEAAINWLDLIHA